MEAKKTNQTREREKEREKERERESPLGSTCEKEEKF